MNENYQTVARTLDQVLEDFLSWHDAVVTQMPDGTCIVNAVSCTCGDIAYDFEDYCLQCV